MMTVCDPSSDASLLHLMAPSSWYLVCLLWCSTDESLLSYLKKWGGWWVLMQLCVYSQLVVWRRERTSQTPPTSSLGRASRGGVVMMITFIVAFHSSVLSAMLQTSLIFMLQLFFSFFIINPVVNPEHLLYNVCTCGFVSDPQPIFLVLLKPPLLYGAALCTLSSEPRSLKVSCLLNYKQFFTIPQISAYFYFFLLSLLAFCQMGRCSRCPTRSSCRIAWCLLWHLKTLSFFTTRSRHCHLVTCLIFTTTP